MGLFIPIVKISDYSEWQQLYIINSYFQDKGGGASCLRHVFKIDYKPNFSLNGNINVYV